MKFFRTLSVLALVIMLGGCASSPLRGTRLPEPAANPEVVNESSNDSAPISAAMPSKSAPNAVAAKPPAPVNKPEAPGATSRRGAYYMDDGPGTEPAPDHRTIPNALPRREPLLTRANRPYVVFGRSYQPMTALVPYRQRGFASWYGRKFHGQKTSSGETYDMFGMTAAHPTLPIPSYVRVTNPANGKSVIVRVNDRGPFHAGRIIDLSYTAAWKLDYIGEGSTLVIVETVVAGAQGVTESPTVAAIAEPPMTSAPPPVALPTVAAAGGQFIQLGAFGNLSNAQALQAHLARELGDMADKLVIKSSGNLHRLQLGPWPDIAAARRAAQVLSETFGLTTTLAISSSPALPK